MFFQNKTWNLLWTSLIFFLLCQIVSFFKQTAITCNTGIGFGIIVPKLVLFFLISAFLTFALFFVHRILQKNSKAPKILIVLGGGFLFGGAISNIIDRLLWGCIPDYFHISFFPMFNLADIGISIGIFFLLFSVLKEKEEK